MIRRFWTRQVPIAAEAQPAYSAHRRTVPGELVSTGEWLAIQEFAADGLPPAHRQDAGGRFPLVVAPVATGLISKR